MATQLSQSPVTHADIHNITLDLDPDFPSKAVFQVALGRHDGQGNFVKIATRTVELTPDEIAAFVAQFGSFKDSVLAFIEATGKL